MKRYKLYIDYLGTRYCGWQRQPEQDSIQEQIEMVLAQVIGDDITIYGQGRTDSGVHALHQTAHVDLDEDVDTEKLKYALLGLLPKDIAVWKIEVAPVDFHARFHAQKRSYVYRIIRQPSAHHAATANLVLQDLTVQKMQQCAHLLQGCHDFKNFSRVDNSQQNTQCTIEQSKWKKRDFLLEYHITANRFLRHLVRRLVGSMLEVGKGEKSISEFRSLLEDEIPSVTPHMARAKGLTLVDVEY